MEDRVGGGSQQQLQAFLTMRTNNNQLDAVFFGKPVNLVGR